MSRLNLVIADHDEAYIENMAAYLSGSHSKRFNVNSFTKKELLMNFLSELNEMLDILLVSPDMYFEEIPRNYVKCVVILAPGKLMTKYPNCGEVNKFQHGEKFVSNVLNMYYDENNSEAVVSSGGKQTKVVSVFSLTGGAGKTSVCTGLSCISSQRGKKTMYINLENVASTPLFFPCESDQNLSRILYYLKDSDKNLALKIESLRHTDPYTDVHYFIPPDSIRELDEIEPVEMANLIRQIRNMGQYDLVFIDMDSSLSRTNIEILRTSDQIIFVLLQDPVTHVKFQTFIKELETIENREGENFIDKFTFVINKFDNRLAFDLDLARYNGVKPIYRIPYDYKLLSNAQVAYLVNVHELFGREVFKIIREL